MVREVAESKQRHGAQGMPCGQLGLDRGFGVSGLILERNMTVVVAELDPAISEIPFAKVLVLRPERRVFIGGFAH